MWWEITRFIMMGSTKRALAWQGLTLSETPYIRKSQITGKMWRSMNLSEKQPENHFSEKLPLKTYSRGMGALGLPGDLSSASRFAKVAFTKMHAISGEGEAESVSQFFHILGSVDQQRGCCEVAEGKYEITLYTSCCNADRGIYYYTTYDNHQITAVDMHHEDLDGSSLSRYPLVTGEQIRWVN